MISFFSCRLYTKGARIHWLAEAVVSEKVPSKRLRLSWILQRNFRYSCDGARFYRKLFSKAKANLLCPNKGQSLLTLWTALYAALWLFSYTFLYSSSQYSGSGIYGACFGLVFRLGGLSLRGIQKALIDLI